jgi:glycosyltransferase involved in cell wall biosynthesis
MPNPTVFYFYTRDATFIRKDVSMLREEFQVFESAFPDPEKWKTPLLFLRQFVFLLSNLRYWNSAVVVCQFAGYHSFLPCFWAKIFGRPSVVVVGGTDCVSFPSLRYGHFQNPLLRLFTTWTYQLVKVVSAVHKSLFYRDNPYGGEEERKQGILHFLPTATFVQNEIPNGFDTDLFRIKTNFEERPHLSFITISVSLNDPIRMKLKGMDLVLELAKKMPEARFTLVGSERKAGIVLPENVVLLPYIPNKELPGLYNQHRYYLQLSLSEGFPNALCEAMASGCIPVVSEVASMPEIVNGNGFVLKQKDVELLSEGISKLDSSASLNEISTSVSDSISSRYSWERRRKALVRLVRGEKD